MMTFQEIIFTLQQFYKKYGCIIEQPYDIEKGAGTFHPATFFRVLGKKSWKVAFVEPCRRPTDGRYAENPNRLQRYFQFQVIIKPAPKNSQEIFLSSLEKLKVNTKIHEIKFVEDDWESPTLGAAGVGWEVWLDGLEITQFTYFQQMAGIELDPISLEITYGLERIAMFLQNKENVFEIDWDKSTKYKDIYLENEVQFSKYNFEYADINKCISMFNMYEEEAKNLLKHNLFFPAYDFVIKCSHIFNILDARRAISVSERTKYITRIRTIAKECANCYLKSFES
jgi:glycyl-tRNA synthetase alpha chain